MLANVALLFVGHGEPANAEDGDVPITHADGTPFGPHGVSLGVPAASQYTEWAAAYEEIATAMTYIFPDLNGNGIPHELELSPAGDVPPFFNWSAFHASVYEHYDACADYSPHNDALRAHVESLDVEVCGADIDVYLAYLDAVPRIRDVVWDISTTGDYEELVVVPMLLAKSTHTDEVEELVEEVVELTGDMDVLVTEPFFEVPFMQRRLKEAVLAMTEYVESAIPPEVEDHNIGVLLASHGSPYVPPVPEYGWVEGEIYSYLIPTEDAFHAEIAEMLPWVSRTGRMNYSSPTIEDALAAFEADGFTDVVVVPSAFPTPAIHTMWDVANAAVGRAVLPVEGVVSMTRSSGMHVFYSAEGYADFGSGEAAFRRGLEFMGQVGVMEALEEDDDDVPCQPDELCFTVTADAITGDALKFMFYETTEDDWPETFADLPIPNWVVMVPPPMPDQFPARIQIPLEDNLLAVAGGTLEGARLGLVVASSTGPGVAPTDARGFSASTLVYEPENPMDYGTVHLAVPTEDEPCQPGEICVTVTGGDVTGPDLKLMLYEATEDNWPQDFAGIPTPGWVVTETVPVPASFPVDIHIPVEDNLFAISTESIEGKRVGLAVVTGVASTFIVEPTDARGFSASTMLFDSLAAMDFGDLELAVPAGDPCDLNPYHRSCLTGPMFWQERFLEAPDFVPGAIYMDLADIDDDGVDDIIMVGEPHFEFPELPLTVLKLGVYYMNADGSVRGTEIIDSWTETDQLFYSPWGVRVIRHGSKPMIIVGTNIPELAPLEDGTGAILSYHQDGGMWVRSIVRQNPDPTETNYNSMIVVPADIDNDGDDDLALSGAFGSSSVGSWMENTGDSGNPWIPHLQPMDPGTDPAIRGTLAYKSADLNGDGYPEVVYNAMFDIPGTTPPRYRGEIWLAVNPGPT